MIAFLGAVLALNQRGSAILGEVSTGTWVMAGVVVVLVLGLRMKIRMRDLRN